MTWLAFLRRHPDFDGVRTDPESAKAPADHIPQWPRVDAAAEHVWTDRRNGDLMPSIGLYCRKCRDAMGHHIARFKASPSDFRRVVVVGMTNSGAYSCRCESCGHTWVSRAKAAKDAFSRS